MFHQVFSPVSVTCPTLDRSVAKWSSALRWTADLSRVRRSGLEDEGLKETGRHERLSCSVPGCLSTHLLPMQRGEQGAIHRRARECTIGVLSVGRLNK
ncbi:hypothetical protein AOLI_G00071860 [Acnodon oligacanthus]